MEPADMIAAVATMQKQTGRTLDEWVDLVRHAGLDPLQQNDVRRWLKDVHGVPKNTQWAVADAAARRAGWVHLDADSDENDVRSLEPCYRRHTTRTGEP